MLRSVVRGVAIGAIGAISVVPGSSANGAPPSAAPTTPGTVTDAPGVPTRAPQPTSDAQQAWNDALRAAGFTPPAQTIVPAAPDARFASPADTASLTVSPDTNLVRGQTVSLTGSGFGATQVFVGQCPAGATQAFSCSNSGLRRFVPDSAGAFSGDVIVHRTSYLTATPLDCASASGACELVAANSSGTIVARHSLDFDPTAPLPQLDVVVTPSTGLLHNQAVSVTGTGYAPGDQLFLRQCADGDLYCYGRIVPVTADTNGAFAASFTVRLRVGDGSGGVSNCIVTSCVIRAESASDSDYRANVAITFDPAQPLPPDPSIHVVPSTGLLHDQEVTVTGADFDPQGYVQINQCDSDTERYCGEYLSSLQADTAGTFSATVKVSRLVANATSLTPSITDCATADCWVSATGYSSEDSIQLTARALVAFDGSVPPPPSPTASGSPSTDLPYRAQVNVHATGFTPGGFVNAYFCALSGGSAACGSSSAYGAADSAGVVDLSIGVKRRVGGGEFGGSLLDCIDAGTECVVFVQGQRGYERTQFTVTFDPNAPIPPPPNLLVFPDHDLGWRQVIGFGGSGFTPGVTSARQCGTVDFGGGESFEECAGFGPAEVNADGFVLGTFNVRRILDFGGLQPVDCATSVNPCTLRVGYGDPDESASVALGFDPNSQPPPPPVLTVTPPGTLLAGQNATVTGTGFTPGTTVGMTTCRSGITAIADACDLGRVFTAIADDTGTVSTTFPVLGVIGTAQGGIDCTTGPGVCALAAANASDLTEFASTPLTVDAPELRIRSITVDEGTGATDTEAEMMVELSAPVATSTTVEWRAVPGTAGAEDYMNRSGRVVIPAGETIGMVHIHIVADSIDEPTERFTIEVSAALGTRVVAPSATVKIRDDDAAPSVSIADGRGREARGRARAEVLLSALSGRTVTVHYVTHHGSARSGSDYIRSEGDVVFQPGETRHVIHVALVDDSVREPTESFRIDLDHPENATLGRSSATVTIRDDD